MKIREQFNPKLWCSLFTLFLMAGNIGFCEQKLNTAVKNHPSETTTSRPLRTPHKLILTIGQDEGDLQGNDDKIIQAGIDYLNRLGGGTLHSR